MNAVAVFSTPATTSPAQESAAGQPSAKALQEMMVDLWTRCSEASWRAALLAQRATTKGDLDTLNNIAKICDVDAIYGRMHTILADHFRAETREEDALREQIRALHEDNRSLRRELATAREPSE